MTSKQTDAPAHTEAPTPTTAPEEQSVKNHYNANADEARRLTLDLVSKLPDIEKEFENKIGLVSENAHEK